MNLADLVSTLIGFGIGSVIIFVVPTLNFLTHIEMILGVLFGFGIATTSMLWFTNKLFKERKIKK